MREIEFEEIAFDDWDKDAAFPKKAGGDYWFDEITRKATNGACSQCWCDTNRFDILIGKHLCERC